MNSKLNQPNVDYARFLKKTFPHDFYKKNFDYRNTLKQFMRASEITNVKFVHINFLDQIV